MEFTSSEFLLSNVPIRYYLTNVKLSSLQDIFKLVEDIPGSSGWGYNAIFQRDIDDNRVEKELLEKYLLNPNKFKFFNPLTIALLPYDAKNNEIMDAYSALSLESNALEEGRMQRQMVVGGVEVQSLPGSTIGKIRWDRNRIMGVAIDGQHRLSALMKYAKHTEQPSGIDPTQVRIPVILLLFDAQKSNVLTQVREIFVDINKNAEPVSAARRILLDDRDPYAVLTRDLIKDQNNPEGLRYEVVDWKREAARPEGESQITTIVVLYEVVKQLFRDRLDQFESELDLNAELARRKMLKIRVADPEVSIYDLSEEQIRVALERFRLRHKTFILKLFESLPPYEAFLRQLSSYVDTEDDTGSVLQEFIFKPSKKRDEFRRSVSAKGLDPIETIDKPLQILKQLKEGQKNAELLFFSIGQQGLFYWFPTLRKIYNMCGYADLTDIAEEYRKDLALFTDHGFFARKMSVKLEVGDRPLDIWQRICLRGDKVAAGKASANRLGALVLLAVAAVRLGIVEDIDQVSVNLKRPLKVVKDEYIKEWRSRLEAVEELTKEYDEFEDEGEYSGNEEVSVESAERIAQDSVHEILKLVRGWAEEQRTLS